MSSPLLAFRGVTCTSDQHIYTTGHGAWNGGYVILPSGQPITVPGAATDAANGNAFVMSLTPDGTLLDFDSFGRATHPDSVGMAYPIDFAAGTSEPALRFRCEPRIAATSDGDLLVSGTMASMRSPWAFTFEGVSLNTSTAVDTALNVRQVFGARYTPQQGVTHAFAMVGGGIESMQRMVVDDAGTYWTCGRLRNILIADNTIYDHRYPGTGANGPYNGFLARADADGDLLWHTAARQWDPYDLAVAADGSAQVLSAFTNTGLFPSTQGPTVGLATTGGADRVLAHYAANGALLSTDRLGTIASEIGYRMATDACGNLHVATVGDLVGTCTYSAAMACNTCDANVRMDVLGTAGCGPTCYAAFDPTRRNASLDHIALDNTSTTEVGDRQVLVKAASNSIIPITTITFGFRTNGGAVNYHIRTGALAFGDTVSNVVIGMIPFGTTNHYTVEAWVDQVNGTPDDDPLNDTLRLEQVLCSSPIVGTYSLGSVGDAFPSFRAANDCLQQCGIAGTTHIEVADGTYYDQLDFGPINGASNADTIVFRAASEIPQRYTFGCSAGCGAIGPW